MCRKSLTCNYVKPPETRVNAPSIRPDEFDQYFTEFADAVIRAKQDGWNTHNPLLDHGAERSLNDWFTEHAQIAYRSRSQGKAHRKPVVMPMKPAALTNQCVRRTNKRDNYRCLYCGNPVLPSEFFKKLTKFVGPEIFRSVGTNIERHGIKLVFSATADHLIPAADGGATAYENLVTSCWPCNYGKAHFTIEELAMNNPFNREHLELDTRVADLLNAIGRPQDLLPE